MILRIGIISIISVLVMGCSTKSLAQKEHDKTMKEIQNLKPIANELGKRGTRLESETTETIRTSIIGSESNLTQSKILQQGEKL